MQEHRLQFERSKAALMGSLVDKSRGSCRLHERATRANRYHLHKARNRAGRKYQADSRPDSHPKYTQALHGQSSTRSPSTTRCHPWLHLIKTVEHAARRLVHARDYDHARFGRQAPEKRHDLGSGRGVQARRWFVWWCQPARLRRFDGWDV